MPRTSPCGPSFRSRDSVGLSYISILSMKVGSFIMPPSYLFKAVVLARLKSSDKAAMEVRIKAAVI